MSVNTSSIQSLYVAYFNRPADASGLAYWEAALATRAATLNDIAAAFAASAEYQANYGSLSNDAKVAAVYQNLFGRQPEPAGLLYWSQALAVGSVTFDKMVVQIANGAQGSDLVAFQNKTSAAVSFTIALDTTEEILSYSGEAALNVAEAYIASVTTNASLAAAIAPAALNATIAQVVEAGRPIPASLNFTLTAGIDAAGSFTGNGGNDTFTTTAQNLSAFDTLDGAAGVDTLNISALTAAGFDSTLVGGLSVKNIEIVNINSVAGIKTDVTGFGATSLNAVNITAGSIDLTAASTTNVVTANSAVGGGIVVKGGLTQTVSANGGVVDLSGAVGAVSVTGANMAASNVTITGGSSVSVTETGVTTGTLVIGSAAVAATGVVTVSSTVASGAGGLITVNGGSSVSVSTSSSNAVNTVATQSAVAVNGSALTTSVAVAAAAAATASATKAGTSAGTVTIIDVNAASATKADVISTVSLTNTGAASIDSAALATLNLSGSNSTVALNRTASDAAANATALTINATGTTTVGAISGTHAADFKTVTINATGTTTIDDLTFAAATTLNVAGAGKVNVLAATGSTLVTTINVGDGGSSFGAALGNNITFTAGSGNDSITVGATTKAINLGAGNNSVTMTSGTLTGSITAGAGTSDSLSLTADTAAAASATFKTKVTGFENLVLTGAASQTVDLAMLGGYTKVSTSGATALLLNSFASGSTLTLTGAGTAYTVANTNFTLGTADVVNLAVTSGSGATVGFGTVTAVDIETVNIKTGDTQATPSGSFNNTLTLATSTATSINVSGNAGLALTTAGTALTSVDASGITLGGFSFTSAALAAAASIKGSATGANVVDFSAAAEIVTYVGGSGADTITATNSLSNTITLGNGTNMFTGAAGSVTVTGGTGADTVTVGAGNNNVSLGDGANSFTATTGKNVFTGGANVDTVVVGGGGNTISTFAGNDLITIGAATSLNTVNVGTGSDTVTFSAVQSAAGFYTSLTGMGGGDIINVAAIDGAGATEAALGGKIVLGSSATFANYLDAAVSGAGVGAVNWFTLNGNTYITVDASGTATFADGVDTVIELIGIVDLSTTSNVAGVITLGGPTT